MSVDPPRVAIYLRISDDRDGLGLGVDRQRKACRELCTQRGWTTVTEYADNDISATFGDPRPDYDRLMAEVDAGHIDMVVVYHQSRLWRNRIDRANGFERLKTARVRVAAARGPDVDFATAYGRFTAGVMGEGDTLESEIKAERIRDKVLELAAAGKIANGGPRPFGYTRVYDLSKQDAAQGRRRRIIRDDINDAEADIIRDCARRVLDGESARSIVGDLNARGVPTSTGGLWTMQALRWMLRSGRIAGLREHRGVVVGPAVWPAIIDRDTHTQLRALLDSKQRPPGSRVRLHYLSGYVYCDACLPRGVRMRVKPDQRGRLVYWCPPKAEGGCNGRVIGLADLEEMVGAYLVARLRDPQTLRDLAAREATADTQTVALLERVESDERRLRVLQAALVDGDEVKVPEVVVSVRQTRLRLAGARAELARRANLPQLARQSLPDLAARWPDLGLDHRRTLLALLVERIVIGPARRGYARFDPSRVDIVPVGRISG